MSIAGYEWYGVVDTPSKSAAKMLAAQFYDVLKQATEVATAA
jgi:hypothetical protein